MGAKKLRFLKIYRVDRMETLITCGRPQTGLQRRFASLYAHAKGRRRAGLLKDFSVGWDGSD
ncbi:MAG TPA: hypothetical protein DEV64_10335 [Rhodospirillaceae bacterium]|nr:hypothetical protein [Rhodospirillaceae bacterium]